MNDDVALKTQLRHMQQRASIGVHRAVELDLVIVDGCKRSQSIAISASCILAVILIIDNYDSFTYNLVQRLGEIDSSLDIQVFRNDQITVDEILERKPDRVIISPGPCTPTEAGISVECCQRLKGKLPLLGVCLGHQSMGQAFGGDDRPREESDARQDGHDPPRRQAPVRRPRESVSGDALSQPRDPARHAVRKNSK